MTREEIRLKIANPATITEADLSYELLDQLAFKVNGPGSCVFEVAGIQVTKSVTPSRSNSGKSVAFSVSISWTGSDGRHRHEYMPSRYSNNRRNDADRNWGLPE